MSKTLLTNINDNQCMCITNEDDLHKKVVHVINKFYPDAIVVSGCINQSTDKLIIQSYSKGYVAGQPDLMIVNWHPSYIGLAIEFKSPTGMGKVSLKQLKFLEKLRNNMWLCLVSNCYDEIIMRIVQYFDKMNLDNDLEESEIKDDTSSEWNSDTDTDSSLRKPNKNKFKQLINYKYYI